MVFKKTAKKEPAVTVETKKISSEACCSGTSSCCKGHLTHVVMSVLIVVNTVLLAMIFNNQTSIEAVKVGGRDNYKLLREVFESDGFKMQQKQQLEQAVEMLKQLPTDGATDTATPQANTETAPAAIPTEDVK